MYDRTVLLAAARSVGDHRPAHLARRLGVARNTAGRLWHGKVAPSASLAALVEQHYGVSARQLIQRTPAEDPATTAPDAAEQAAA